MAIEFDPDKEARNLAVHGVSLTQTETMLSGFTVEWVDRGRDYGEIRIIALGEIGGREFLCVYTERGETIRPISLRRANRKERDVYQQAKADRTAGQA
jgi:uncharacterized protein